ncbi:hypothetical protein [Streptomyces sp. NPDC055749]
MRHRTPDTGHRTPDTGPGSEPEVGVAPTAPVFGMSPPWLLVDGAPLADALVLSQPEQIDRLRAACPEAAPTAVLAGDPCFDRMLAARPYRERFRRALGVRQDQRLVVLNSTWSPESLFGDGFGDGGDDTLAALLPRLTSEFPVDEYRFAAILHPNIWHGHGPGQIRAWLDRARRGGLMLIDPLAGWRQALLAADAVIGDHGSVTYYAAALGTPVLLGAAPLESLDPDAPISAFMRDAPRLDPGAALRAQVDALIAGHRPLPGPAEFTTSVPGESAARLRALFYALMDAPEPEWRASLTPLPLPACESVTPTLPLHVVTLLTASGSGEVAVSRWAGPPPVTIADAEVHIAVHEDTRDVDQLDLAEVVFRYGAADDRRFGDPAAWTAEVLGRHRGCSLAAYVTGPREAVVRARGGELLRLVTERDDGPDPAVAASALHALLAAGRPVAEVVADGLWVRVGGGPSRRVRVVPLGVT